MLHLEWARTSPFRPTSSDGVYHPVCAALHKFHADASVRKD